MSMEQYKDNMRRFIAQAGGFPNSEIELYKRIPLNLAYYLPESFKARWFLVARAGEAEKLLNHIDHFNSFYLASSGSLFPTLIDSVELSSDPQMNNNCSVPNVRSSPTSPALASSQVNSLQSSSKLTSDLESLPPPSKRRRRQPPTRKRSLFQCQLCDRSFYYITQ